jgi:hypothetical protein
MGHEVAPLESTSPVVARVDAIMNEEGWLEGATDPRASADAEGY